jgi:hypothetical protein
MSKPKSICVMSLGDIQQIQLGDFLKPDPPTDLPSEPPPPTPLPPVTSGDEPDDDEPFDEDTPPPDDENGDSPHDETLACHNPQCSGDIKTLYHIYEIDHEPCNNIVICGQCYDNGYRFCLLTHEVLHVTQLKPVLGNMFISLSFDEHLLSPEKLQHIADIYDYMNMIGIVNPNPLHLLIKTSVES